MKKLLLTIALLTSVFASAQNTQPVTRADINQINLRLDGVERFGQQHRTGNHLMIAGTILSGIGSLIIYNNTLSKYKGYTPKEAYKMYKQQNRIGLSIIGVGSGLATVGLVMNIDSFRHLRVN